MSDGGDPVEQWACRNFAVVDVDSVERTYSGAGPPSWQGERPEIERPPAPHRPHDWWPMVRLTELRQVTAGCDRVLDLGCGPGWPSVPLAAHVADIVAVDASPLALSLLRRSAQGRRVGNVRPVRARANALPFAEATFDMVVMADLMDVVPEPEAVAREALRVLRPGGRLVSWVQNQRYLLSGQPVRHERAIERKGGCTVYSYRKAAVQPPHSLELSFPLDAEHPALRAAGLRPGAGPTVPRDVIAELKALRPAVRQPVERYRAVEFLPETAGHLFAAAGFVDVRVRPLDPGMVHAFARELELGRALPVAPEGFESQAAALLTAMRKGGFKTASDLSVTGRKPA